MIEIDKYCNAGETIKTRYLILWGGGGYGNSAACYLHLNNCPQHILICDRNWNDPEKLAERVSFENRYREVYLHPLDAEYVGTDRLKDIVSGSAEDFSAIIAVAKDETAEEIRRECRAIGIDEDNIYRFISENIEERSKKFYQKRLWGKAGKNTILSDDVANAEIRNMVKNGTPFLISRWGSTENTAQMQYMNGCLNEGSLYNLQNASGIFPSVNASFLKSYFPVVERAAAEIDFYVCGAWNPFGEELQELLTPGTCLVLNSILPPCPGEESWFTALAGKKVLIVHPFAPLIESQYRRRTLLWKNADAVLPEWNLKTYATVQSLGGSDVYATWLDALHKMEDDIGRIDFDCALIAGGGYGMPLGAFIKSELKKQAVHVGGQLQLLFGIKGKRWDEWFGPDHYNEYWVRPSDDLKPKNFQSVEGGCYW